MKLEVEYIYIYIYIYNLTEVWGFRLVKSQFPQLVSAYGHFQVNSFIIRDLQICEKLYDLRYMFCSIFPDKMFLSSLQ